MAVMAREAWTAERMDDLKEKVTRRFDDVDNRFDQVDKRFDRVEAEMKASFVEVNGRIDGLSDSVNKRFDSMQRTMIICFATLLASIWASVIGAVLAVLL